MRKSPLAFYGCMALLATLSAPAFAATLHGYCGGAGQCIDNGTNSPTSTNPPANFGFTSSPGATGDLFVDLLVPNNLVSNPSSLSFGLTGTLTGTATLFNASAWSTGSLAPYLGISASPDNPIGAYLPSTQALDAGATGFFIYQADLGAATLQSPSNPNVSPLENLSSGLPQGSYIVGFLNTGTAGSPNFSATANSGAIFLNSTPLPAALPLFASGLGAMGLVTWRRKRKGPAAGLSA
jgi:hypothetical protein